MKLTGASVWTVQAVFLFYGCNYNLLSTDFGVIYLWGEPIKSLILFFWPLFQSLGDTGTHTLTHTDTDTHTYSPAQRRLLFLYCGNQWEYSIAQFNAHIFPTNSDAHTHTPVDGSTGAGRGFWWLCVGKWIGNILLPPSGDNRHWVKTFLLSLSVPSSSYTVPLHLGSTDSQSQFFFFIPLCHFFHSLPFSHGVYSRSCGISEVTAGHCWVLSVYVCVRSTEQE